MRFALVATLLLTGSSSFAEEKKIKIGDLPPAVRATVEQLGKTSKLAGLSKEEEDGKTLYEAATKMNGKTRDVTIDAQGRIVTVEQEVELSAIPAPARAAIEKAANGGKIHLVETVTTGSDVKYEASITPKGGKKKEVLVTADGSVAK